MPLREIKRLQALDRFLSIEFENEKEVRDLVQLAAEICGAKIASITILDAVKHHYRYNWSVAGGEVPWDDLFFSLTADSIHPVVVPDLHADPKFSNHPFVTEIPSIHFYAGVPLLTHDEHHVGSLCVLDDHSLTLTETQVSMLSILAKQIVQLFELQASIMLLKEKLEDARKSQIQLKSFFESKWVIHLLLDKEFRIISFNSIFAKLVWDNFKTTPQEGDDIRAYIQKDTGAKFVDSYSRALNGESHVIQTQVVNEVANTHWLVYFELALDPENEIIGVSCNALDITKNVKQEAQLTQQNEHLRQVAFYQSHDLRRPVSSILGIVEYLSGKFGNEVPEELEMLKLSTRELDEKIKNIVNLTDFNHK
ncbi:GAF domain-containing protein [Sphingobacterium paludis]|uniref:GAF domain-containing protein n=1 Tax=Sphingobacterium paludis TaxID=1476465 RepID=A0A4R7DB42_9SPHI|nr:GAF domain-containing protein [Sphingobacterium paludis]TDS17662.1 GAF domain-containing protein [Sphingobacterium paludis]